MGAETAAADPGRARPIRVALSGHLGRVGSAVAPWLASEPGFEYVGGAGSADDLASFLEERRPDALVDFTRPASALANALAAVAAGAIPVIGTSGLSPQDVSRLELACDEAGLAGLVAPNFALGAVVMIRLAEIAAAAFDAVDIVESHGPGKLDAPSSTALETARRVGARKRFQRPAAQHTIVEGARGGETLGVGLHSLRLPGVIAEQEVRFGLAGQSLEIAHRVTSREAYAPGVILAVRRLMEAGGFHRGLESLLDLG